jgi:type IV secretion system protein VirD4
MGSRLHTAGVGAEAPIFDLVRARTVIFITGPQRYMTRLSPYFSLHLQSILDALYRGAGPVTFLNDEFTNTPLKSFVDALTTIRGFGCEAHNIAQSRSEIEKKFGKLEAQTIEDNAVFKLWLGFSSYQEAEMVSKAMGESLVVQHGLNVDHQNISKMGSGLSIGRQRWMSPAELMALSPRKVVWWAKGVGFGVDELIRQNEFAPFCYQLAPNPVEGGLLPPNPKITLKLPEGDM